MGSSGPNLNQQTYSPQAYQHGTPEWLVRQQQIAQADMPIQDRTLSTIGGLAAMAPKLGLLGGSIFNGINSAISQLEQGNPMQAIPQGILNTGQSLAIGAAMRMIPISNISYKGIKTDEGKDLADEISNVGAEINNGKVTLYHRTTPEAANQILKTGQMTSKENGIFFSTSPSGQAQGYGNKVIKMQIPIDKLELDDIFDKEAHVVLPSIQNTFTNVKKYIKGIL